MEYIGAGGILSVGIHSLIYIPYTYRRLYIHNITSKEYVFNLIIVVFYFSMLFTNTTMFSLLLRL